METKLVGRVVPRSHPHWYFVVSAIFMGSVLMAFMRLTGANGPTFQAFAYIWIGFLIGMGVAVWRLRGAFFNIYFLATILLTTVEVYASFPNE